MLKNDNIRIKQKDANFLLSGFLYLFLILAGIFLIGLPFLPIAPASSALRAVFLAIGIVFAVGGGTLYGFLLYRGLCPKDALIITNKGFTNRLIGGKDGVYVEWIGVASMKIFGLTKSPMLGLTLADNESYILSLDGKAARDARANLELGLPVIAISQRDVYLQISELKNLFSRMIKGAISWEQYASQNATHGKTAEAAPAGKPVSPESESPKHFTPEEEAPVQKKQPEDLLFMTRTVEAPLTEEPAPDTETGEEITMLDMDDDTE